MQPDYVVIYTSELDLPDGEAPVQVEITVPRDAYEAATAGQVVSGEVAYRLKSLAKPE